MNIFQNLIIIFLETFSGHINSKKTTDRVKEEVN